MTQDLQIIRYFSPQPEESELPQVFYNPFGSEIHPLAVRASEQLQKLLKVNRDFAAVDAGGMFGVLVVKDSSGKIGFVSAYAATLLDQGPKNKKKNINFVPAINEACFETYSLQNRLGEKKQISELFDNPLSLSGVGDCAAPKLLQYAILNDYLPLALAEFWFGSSPPDAVRHHKQFYPACRGKCWPILPFMLKGLNVKPLIIPGASIVDPVLPETIYEDEDLLIVNKPAGLLSVPGKDITDSVLTRLQSRYPDATGPMLLHRLDLSTSGLLLAAKNSETHKALQQQFMNRTVEKRYVAILSNNLFMDKNLNDILPGTNGVIDLPLRVDIEDRPRQLVCHLHGKKAVTKWQIIKQENKLTRVYFYPVTGRTHQLRIHAAHKDGLNAPIAGDPLYGASFYGGAAERLMLHAEQLCFTHPTSGKRMIIESPAPF